LIELLRLRIKDVDLGQEIITVRAARATRTDLCHCLTRSWGR